MNIEVTVKSCSNYVPLKLRVNDIAIMELLLTHDHAFTELQMRQINSYRLYLGVMYLSEICNVNGTHVVDVVRGTPTISMYIDLLL